MSRTVLLVDDDSRLLDGLRRALRAEPYELITACSPADALALLATRNIDVVVSDERMPGMSGTRLLAEVRRDHPSTVAIMLTGLASLETALAAINQGEVHRFFLKPVAAGDLAAGIRSALQQRELLVQGRRLLVAVRRQQTLLEELETRHPGIGSVSEEADGAILIDEDTEQSAESFLAQAGMQLARLGV